jgi:hypothetical protein
VSDRKVKLCVTCEHIRKGVCGRYPPPWPEIPEESCGEYRLRWGVIAAGMVEERKAEVGEKETLKMPDVVKGKLDVPVSQETVRE